MSEAVAEILESTEADDFTPEHKLPSGWVQTQVGDVVPKPKSKLKPDAKSNLDFVGMDHIEPYSFDLVGKQKFREMKSAASHFFPGDVLYGRQRPYLNKIHLAKFEGAASAEFIIMSPTSAINADFLKYLMHQQSFVNFAMAHSSGDRPRVNYTAISKFSFKLPPLAEQKRIVSKIDELFSDIGAGERALRRAREALARYRKSILKAAVTGALTADWREENKDNLEPADKLLACILKARRAAWEKAELAKLKAKGKEPKGDAWKKKYKEPVTPRSVNLIELPFGWTWATIDQLSMEVRYGSSSKCSDDETGVPVLRMGNLGWGTLDVAKLKYLPKNHSELPDLLLDNGDLLFNRTNSAELVGKTVVYRNQLKIASFASYLIRVRFLNVPPEYVAMFINSVFGRHWIAGVVSQQVGQANVNGTKLKACAIPLPPISEIEEIISRVEEVVSKADHVEAALDEQERAARALKQSILKAAFEGRLVPQDPADEPAAELLERIKTNGTAK